MSGFREMFRGVVYPWHCDHLGHMTVMHYVGMFDQAAWHLLSALGFTWENSKANSQALVDAKHTIQYLEEQRAGSLIVIESALIRIGGKSVTELHRMKNSETGALVATSEMVAVYFDLKTRSSLPIPETMRQSMREFLVEAED